MTLADLIKPLAWETYCSRSGSTSAKAFGGEYVCERAGDEGHYGLWLPHSSEDADPVAYRPSLEDAQADYAARILSALDPDAITKIRADALRDRTFATMLTRAEKAEARVAELEAGLRKIADAPAWGAPDRWEITPFEVRQLARALLKGADE